MKLTRKQKAFADALLNDNKISATQAVIDAGYDVKDRHIARQIAGENFQKPAIQAYLDIHAQQATDTVLEIMSLSRSKADDSSHATVALRAAQDILDRKHGKAVQQVETRSVGVTIAIDLTGLQQV